MPRADGRANDQLRPVVLTRHFSKYAEGSCLIELGDTQVLCTATISEEVPSFLRGGRSGWVTAEYGMLPRSTAERTPRDRARAGRAQEIQRLIGRCLRAVVDLNALGERTITLDCDVIQADGGTRTAAITGGHIALVDALETLRAQGIFHKLPLLDSVAAVSVGLVQGEARLDLSYQEDSVAAVDFNLVMTGAGRFVEVQGTAEGAPFTRENLDLLLNLGIKGIRELTQHQKQALESGNATF